MTSPEIRTGFDSTNAGGFMGVAQVTPTPLVGCTLVGPGTSTVNAPALGASWRAKVLVDQTTAGVAAPSVVPAGASIGELRRLSGLTWDQLARVFKVSRRSVHFWSSGKAMAASNEEHLQRVLAVVRKVDRGSAVANRTALLGAADGGGIVLDLLVLGEYEKVIEQLGISDLRRQPAMRLSEDARAVRAPLPPEVLVGAIQDRIHRDSGVVRTARSVRVRSVR